jgi:hypothetical protein
MLTGRYLTDVNTGNNRKVNNDQCFDSNNIAKDRVNSQILSVQQQKTLPRERSCRSRQTHFIQIGKKDQQAILSIGLGKYQS